MTVQELFEKGFRPGDEFYKYCADCGECATTNIDSCPACLVTLMRASEASEHDGAPEGNLTEGNDYILPDINRRANEVSEPTKSCMTCSHQRGVFKTLLVDDVIYAICPITNKVINRLGICGEHRDIRDAHIDILV